MEPFTQSATLKHIMSNIPEASAASALYRQDIRTEGAENVTDL
jgi:hypothetical protein